MSPFDPEYSLLALIVAAVLGFALGRATAGAFDPRRQEARRQQKRQDALSAADDLARLPAAKRDAIKRLVEDGRIIEAVRDIRGALGIGLKEAKDVADLIREQEAVRGSRAP